ncbi:MAG: hypothetical protein ABIA78_01610 [archaeon]
MEEKETEKKEENKKENKKEEENSESEDNFEKKDNKNQSFGKDNLTDKMRENPFILSTLVLGVLTLILLIGTFGGTGNITGGTISGSDAGDKFLEFAKAQGADAELVGVEDAGNFYEVTLAIDGSDVPLMVTKDGKYFLSGGLVPLDIKASTQGETTSQAQDIPKSDKPIVELFIWGYCPYGVQAQSPLAEVALLLGDYADFKAVLYHDGHGPFETQENKIQECIQEVAPEKYWDYAAGFAKDIYSKCGSTKDVECDKTEAVKLMESLGIDSDEVLSCVDSKGNDLLSDAVVRAKKLGVTGSPTLVINGVKANPARNAEAFKTVVCGAFNDAPEECSTVLDEISTTASGNC